MLPCLPLFAVHTVGWPVARFGARALESLWLVALRDAERRCRHPDSEQSDDGKAEQRAVCHWVDQRRGTGEARCLGTKTSEIGNRFWPSGALARCLKPKACVSMGPPNTVREAHSGAAGCFRWRRTPRPGIVEPRIEGRFGPDHAIVALRRSPWIGSLHRLAGKVTRTWLRRCIGDKGGIQVAKSYVFGGEIIGRPSFGADTRMQ